MNSGPLGANVIGDSSLQHHKSVDYFQTVQPSCDSECQGFPCVLVDQRQMRSVLPSAPPIAILSVLRSQGDNRSRQRLFVVALDRRVALRPAPLLQAAGLPFARPLLSVGTLHRTTTHSGLRTFPRPCPSAPASSATAPPPAPSTSSLSPIPSIRCLFRLQPAVLFPPAVIGFAPSASLQAWGLVAVADYHFDLPQQA
jgi:hypothetical protein